LGVVGSHPGTVGIYGRGLAENHHHMRNYNSDTKMIPYKSWQHFFAPYVSDQLYSYITFRSMIDSLLKDDATDAVDLLRSYFVGFLGEVSLPNRKDQMLADFLTSEGVLLRPNVTVGCYHMASPLMDELVRNHIIPERFPDAPSSPPPVSSGQLLFLDVLRESLKFFDKEAMCLAASRSYKESKVNVNGSRRVQVPKESVYDTELMRILMNWLTKHGRFTVTGRWHLLTDLEKHKYSDIVIKKQGMPTIVLELLATGEPEDVEVHIERTPSYKDLLHADEAWVIHFTCEDDYLNHPIWQSDEQLRMGVNVVHCWHDVDFSTVMMSARWKDVDGNVQQVDKQALIL
jgi:hypothetical protein